MIDERHIVTVAHVIEGATSILVEVNGDLAEAVTVGFDKERDITLLRSDVPLGDQTFELQDIDYTTGDQIFAIGFPRGLDASLTTGVISNREVEFDFLPFSRFIQVDAALNPGNSGGPVFDQFGQVIGIVNGGFSESQGLNFAVAGGSVDRIVASWVGEDPIPTGRCDEVLPTSTTSPPVTSTALSYYDRSLYSEWQVTAQFEWGLCGSTGSREWLCIPYDGGFPDFSKRSVRCVGNAPPLFCD